MLLGILLAAAIGYTAWIAAVRKPETGVVEIAFLDVGQGDSALITTEDGCILIDTGVSEEAQFVHNAAILYGNRLRALLLTHPHSDHMGGAAYILQHMETETLLLPAAAQNDPALDPILRTAQENGTTIYFCTPETEFRLGEVCFRILAPLAEYADTNEQSLVVRMEYGSVSALFTGDAEAESEADQLALYGNDAHSLLRADILKVGHHGSDTSSTFAYLQAVSPRYAVISCGKGNSYGHPAQDILERLSAVGADVFRTDRNGTIRIRTDGKSITVSDAQS